MSTGSLTSTISTHVLDTALGCPARQLRVTLALLDADGSFRALADGLTDADGRISDWRGPHPRPEPLSAGAYRLTFDTGAYLAATGRPVFYPRVDVIFTVDGPPRHHHIPLLLSPFGYSTYRGT
jgi:5-hydroxyisourate hydrolase